MSNDPNSSLVGSDPALSTTSEERGRSTDLYTRLDENRAFRPAAVIVTAVLAGLLIAPQLATQSYPTDPALIGTPAAANYKAPRDIELVDEEATNKLRDTAAADVLRVYDFDTRLGEKLAQSIIDGFAFLRPAVDAFQIDHPEVTATHLPRAHEQKIREGLRTQVAPYMSRFEKALGTTLKPEELDVLLASRYDPDLGSALGRAVREALSRPIVGDRTVLQADRDRGFTLQRVPNDETKPQSITDTAAITDVDTLRRTFAAHVAGLFPDTSSSWRDFISSVGTRVLQPTVTPNRAATEVARQTARNTVEPIKHAVKKGEMVIRDGERLTRRHLLLFAVIEASGGRSSIVLAATGAALAVLLLLAVGLGWVPGRERRFVLTSRDVLFVATLFLAGVTTARIWTLVSAAVHERFTVWPLEAFIFLLPFAAGAMITRLVLRTNVAVWFAILSSVVLCLAVETDRSFALFAIVGSIIGATRIRAISARGDVLRAGVWVGAGQAGAALVLQLFSGQTSLAAYLTTIPAAFAGGVLSGLATLALAPVIETIFGYTTDLKLLELANLNHPALKDLIVQAPGSYHHSVIVGALVESAAEAIGANPLLARVMAYYHDIGKGCNPQYFIENQRAGQNPHDKIKPSMSAMVIKRHVSDGLDIARRYRLGEPIRAAIAEHHGTTLIHYFFHKAKEQAEDPTSISENDYRYPGSKPQSREAALVMLGDSVEAAARSVADPTPARLAGVVARIVNLKFTDEQLEECDITLKDLHLIAKSFSTVLASIYHTRPEYPELLKELASTKKTNGDSDPKAPRRPRDFDAAVEDSRPENLRRLGLS